MFYLYLTLVVWKPILFGLGVLCAVVMAAVWFYQDQRQRDLYLTWGLAIRAGLIVLVLGGALILAGIFGLVATKNPVLAEYELFLQKQTSLLRQYKDLYDECAAREENLVLIEELEEIERKLGSPPRHVPNFVFIEQMHECTGVAAAQTELAKKQDRAKRLENAGNLYRQAKD